MFFAKFRGHRVKIEKVMTETLSQLNALVLIPRNLNPSLSTLLRDQEQATQDAKSW